MKKIILFVLSLGLISLLFVAVPAMATSEDATLTIGQQDININDINAEDSVSLVFTLENADTADAIGIAAISYDSEKFELVEGVWSLPSGTMLKKDYGDHSGNGELTANAMYSANKDLNGEIFTLTLKCLEPTVGKSVVSCEFSLTSDDGDNVIETEVVAGYIAIHDYSRKAVSSAAVKTKPTCTANGVYYYSCTECDAVDTSAYFTASGTATGHKGGTATCNAKAKCSTCGVAYGSLKAHTIVTLKAKAASCSVAGLTAGKKCSVCSTVTVAQKKVAKKAHSYETTTTKATLTKNGSIVKACSDCGTKASTTAIKMIKTVKLNTASYTYNGSAKSPTVTVKDSAGKSLKKNTDYTVSYASGRKNVGKYKVTVTFKGNYSGSKVLYFTINPAETTVKSVVGVSKSVKITVNKKSEQVTGYEIEYSTSKSFGSAKSVKITGTSTTIKKLTAKKTYYVRVRTYKKVDSTIYYSDWSKAKSAKTK